LCLGRSTIRATYDGIVSALVHLTGSELLVHCRKDDPSMQTVRTPLTPSDDDVLCGLAVYSSDFVPLGRVADVKASVTSEAETIAGRLVTVEPNPTVRYVLNGDDLVVSESMIFQAEPAEDRVILNLPARRVLRASPPLHEQLPTVANTHPTCQST